MPAMRSWIFLTIIGTFSYALVGCVRSGSAPDVYWESILNKRKSIDRQNFALVQTAAAALDDRESIDVDEVFESQCQYTPGRYRISKIDRKLHVEINILAIRDAKDAAPEFEQKISIVKSCIPEVKKIWARYGVNFELTIQDAPSDDIIQNFITLASGEGRSEMRKWYLNGEHPCRMINHELGHHLGLPDEYAEDGTCRTRGSESSETDVVSYMNEDVCKGSDCLSWGAFYPRHLTAILAPIRSKVPKLPPLTGFTLTSLKTQKIPAAREILIGSENPGEVSCKIIVAGQASTIATGQRMRLILYPYRRTRMGDFAGELEFAQLKPDKDPSKATMTCRVPDTNWEKIPGLLKPNFDLARELETASNHCHPVAGSVK